ncbi:MAG TPA: single-stranded-DNA-specific exonuclease RecJ [Verrucomicrobiales bacterium]|nr:single-stranded-DNA-specific exonuclease RecJ [Verrucomicrobiales bacterium]
MKFRWMTAPEQPVLVDFLTRELKVSPLLAQCLLNRGMSEPGPIREFLDPKLRNLADPFLLPNLRAAVTRLLEARSRGEGVVIFGDYDVDGVTATTLLYETLTRLGWKVDCYLPHRMEEGYGLTQSAVENCLAKYPAPLLLAVDCGSTAVESIAWLQGRGVDVIVLDHHQVSTPPPAALALVNPHLAPADGSAPAFRELCSAGLAFKLAHAVVKQAREENLPGALEVDLKGTLDLVALGTIADLVPLTGENRILVTAGLERINRTRRAGLLALMQVAGIERRVQGYEVGFQLAPRLNAAGRLETATAALDLLLAPDLPTALPLAQSLDTCNRERQTIERGIVDQVLGSLRTRFDPGEDFVIIEGDLLWHIGVVGIVASRICHEFYRPSIVLGGDGHEWRGSGRSIEGFDLAAALRECSDLLVRHGGHAMAAGLSLQPSRVNELRERLNQIARRTLTPEQLQPRLRLDAEVRVRDLTRDRIEELGRLQQTGMGNPAVQLWCRGCMHHRPLQRIGADRKHAKLWITQPGAQPVEAIWWGAGDLPLPVGTFDLAFAPKLNEYNGTTHVQLNVLDWRPTVS